MSALVLEWVEAPHVELAWVGMDVRTIAVPPRGPKTIAAVVGPPGKSAYRSWLEQGNTGTEADFVASTQGTSQTPDDILEYIAALDAALSQ